MFQEFPDLRLLGGTHCIFVQTLRRTSFPDRVSKRDLNVIMVVPYKYCLQHNLGIMQPKFRIYPRTSWREAPWNSIERCPTSLNKRNFRAGISHLLPFQTVRFFHEGAALTQILLEWKFFFVHTLVLYVPLDVEAHSDCCTVWNNESWCRFSSMNSCWSVVSFDALLG